jgi:hypothetical protein
LQSKGVNGRRERKTRLFKSRRLSGGGLKPLFPLFFSQC